MNGLPVQNCKKVKIYKNVKSVKVTNTVYKNSTMKYVYKQFIDIYNKLINYNIDMQLDD